MISGVLNSRGGRARRVIRALLAPATVAGLLASGGAAMADTSPDAASPLTWPADLVQVKKQAGCEGIEVVSVAQPLRGKPVVVTVRNSRPAMTSVMVVYMTYYYTQGLAYLKPFQFFVRPGQTLDQTVGDVVLKVDITRPVTINIGSCK